MSELMRIAQLEGITLAELLHARGVGNHLIADLCYGAPPCKHPLCSCHD